MQWFGKYIAYDTSLRFTDVPAGDRKFFVGRLIDTERLKTKYKYLLPSCLKDMMILNTVKQVG